MRKIRRSKKTMDGGGGSEFFICFTSRPSSSAAAPSAPVRAPSTKSSLMSPGRCRDPSSSTPSLSASLSRRLRSSGSVKGGQSPMFPSAKRKGGGGSLEPAEPSSPKVTCIGQVRVKTKKKMKKKSHGHVVVRSRSQREASFRRGDGGERRWVHQLPISICEALRAIGSEFNCFVPCSGGNSGGGHVGRSSNCSSAPLREEKREKRASSSSSCGAVFARWLMAIQESEEEGKGGKMGELGLVVKAAAEEEEAVVVVEKAAAEEKGEMEEEQEGRVSVCVPPRNALLLMRCRSDPVRMAALANRFWGSPAAEPPCRVEVEKEVEEDKENGIGNGIGIGNGERRKEEYPSDGLDGEKAVVGGEERSVETEGDEACLDAGEAAEREEARREEEAIDGEIVNPSEAAEAVVDLEEDGGISAESALEQAAHKAEEAVEEEDLKEGIIQCVEREEEEEAVEGRKSIYIHCSSSTNRSSELRRSKSSSSNGSCLSKGGKESEGRRRSYSSKDREKRRHSFSTEREARRPSFPLEKDARRASFSIDRGGRRRWSFSLDKPLEPVEPKKDPTASAREEKQTEEETAEEEAIAMEIAKAITATAATAEEKTKVEAAAEKKSDQLPDCLLLMMYEPKLSMEVSKETWVCGTDFLRSRPYRPPQPPKPTTAAEAAENRAVTTPTAPAAPLPPLPPQPPTVTAVEQKLVVAAVGQFAPPFVLTRCKSEPVKSSARLAPDACFWKSRHQPIGAAGVGF